MSGSNKHRTDFTPLGSVIGDLLRRHRPTTTQSMFDVWEIWDQAVGPEVAAYARPAAINGSVILVHVTNSSWLHHLRFMEAELISRLNQAFNDNRVRALKFKIGPI